MSRTGLNNARGNPANGGRGARTGPAGNNRPPARVREREREDAGLAEPAPVPKKSRPISATLARDLKQLKERLRHIQLSEIASNELTQLMNGLHGFQKQIRQAMRDHAQQAPVPGLCQAFVDFVAGLDKALVGEAAQPGRDASRAKKRDCLPLSSLDMAQVESLCLGVSALAYTGGRLPFPEAKLVEVSASLSSLCAKLMAQNLALGGADTLQPGPLLNICNLIRRLVAAGLIDPRHKDHSDTRQFCVQTFKAFQAWAERKRKLDTSHDVSKCASLLEMMFDSELGGVTDPEQARALVKVLEWLFGDSLERIVEAGDAVALGGQVNLAKRLLECGKLSPRDRTLDPMWGRFLRAMRSMGPARMIDEDGRPLCAFANLLRTMMDADMPRLWQAIAGDKNSSGKQKADALKMMRQFAAANAHIIASFSDPAFKNISEVLTISNLFSYIKAGDKQRKAGWAEEGQWPDQASFAEGARLLADALPPEDLAGLKGQRLVGGLFTALGYAWQEGLVSVQGSALSCLLGLMAPLAGTGLWQDRYVPALRSLLARLVRDGHINEQQLLSVINVTLKAPGQGWTKESFLEYERQKMSIPVPRPEPLKLEQAPQDEDELPQPRHRTLVGETRLAEIQQSTPAPAQATPPRLVSLSRPNPVGRAGGGARSRAARRAGADWDDSTSLNLSAALAPPQLRAPQPDAEADAESDEPQASPLAPPPSAAAGAKRQAEKRKAEKVAAEKKPAEKRHKDTGRSTVANTGNTTRLTTTTTTTSTTSTTITTTTTAASLSVPDLISVTRTVWSDEVRAKLSTAVLNVMCTGQPGPIKDMLEQNAHASLAPLAKWAALEMLIENGHADALDVVLKHPDFQVMLDWIAPSRGSLLHVALDAAVLPGADAQTAEKRARRDRVFKRLLAEPALRRAACKSYSPGKDALTVALERDLVAQIGEMLKHQEFRSLLLEIRPEDDLTALCYAVIYDKPELLKVLLPMSVSEARKLRLIPGAGLLPLEHAIQRGSLSMARMLLEDPRSYRNFDASKLDSLAARAAKAELWELVPELLAIPAFAAQAGKPGPDGKTLLVRVILAQRGDMLPKLLLNPGIAESAFTKCELSVDRADPLLGDILATLGAATPKRRLDAVMLAIESCKPELWKPLLAMPQASEKLATNQVWRFELLTIAQLRGNAGALRQIEKT